MFSTHKTNFRKVYTTVLIVVIAAIFLSLFVLAIAAHQELKTMTPGL